MAESDNTSVSHIMHIKKIHMENWWIFRGETNLEFNEDKLDSVMVFIGANNCGKTIVLSSLEIAANCLKCFLPDTEGNDLSSILDSYQDEWPDMNKFDTKAHSLFAAEMSGEVIFGMYTPEGSLKWDWKEDDGPDPSVCFLIHRSRLYSVRHRPNCYKLKVTDLDSDADYVKKLKDSHTNWEDEEENMEIFCNVVEKALPWCVVNDAKISVIYSGSHVGDHVEGMQNTDGMMVDTTTNHKSTYRDISSGNKFLAFTKNVIDNMCARRLPKSCLVLEEPTRCMNRAMIRRFLKTLNDVCKQKNIQVIMSTHAPTAVECTPLSNVFRFSHLKDTEVEVRCVVPVNKKLFYPKRWLYPCLFAQLCALVEGPTDQRILENLFYAMLNKDDNHILEKVLSDKPEQDRKRIATAFRNCLKDLVVVDVQGKGNFKKNRNDIIRLGIPYVIICDGDSIFGGAAKEMNKTITLTSGDLQKQLQHKSKVFHCERVFENGVKTRTMLYTGVTEDNLEDIRNAEQVWKIAEKGNIFCPSQKDNFDLESLIGNCYNKSDIAYTCSDEEISYIIQRLFTEKEKDIERFFIFFTEFANKLSTIKSLRVLI